MTRVILGIMAVATTGAPGASPDAEEVKAAIVKAVTTMHGKYSRHGGYVWRYSPDGLLRVGEGQAGASASWIQPPGTPTVGVAFLEAWKVTGDPRCQEAAADAAASLVKGQLHSGGWYYRVEYEPELRKNYRYRIDGGASPQAAGPAGWETWKQRKNKGNMSMLDDDTTQSALRFLLQAQRDLKLGERPLRGEIQETIDHGLRALIGAQYPMGAWSHNFDAFPEPGPTVEDYPILPASYPDSWERTWPKAWDGCYHLNDNITADAIRTLLAASRLTGKPEALEAAKRGGDFLIRARMPEPQPAWAQQYDKGMQPTWERKFEPPAITGGESQDAMEVLMDLYLETRDEKYLDPIPAALAYLKKSETSPGKLARYYELKTNKPIYFTKDYRLTYDSGDVPDHYAFTVGSRLKAIERRYKACRTDQVFKIGAPSDERILKILRTVNEDGVWLEPGFVRDLEGRKVVPKEGILSSQTFADNVIDLCSWLFLRR